MRKSAIRQVREKLGPEWKVEEVYHHRLSAGFRFYRKRHFKFLWWPTWEWETVAYSDGFPGTIYAWDEDAGRELENILNIEVVLI